MKDMKIIKLIFCFIAAYFIAGCDNDYPLKKEQYEKFVYLTRAIDNELHQEYVNYAYDRDTVFVSVSVSGSQSAGKDVTVSFKEINENIDFYNALNLSASDIQYRHLPENVYEYPVPDVTIKSSEFIAVYPVYINPESLHCDSLYLLPISIESVSDYEVRDNIDSVLLMKIIPVNNYTGDYYIDAFIYDLAEETSSSYQMYRTAVATNRNTIRIYHQEAENKDHLQSHTITLTFKEDNTVTFDTWNEFNLTGGSGTYLTEMKLVDFSYFFKNGDKEYEVKGFLYKRPVTELEQEDIDDFIKKERDKDK